MWVFRKGGEVTMEFINEAINKEAVFTQELKNIKTMLHQEIAKICIMNAPEYFWVIPASSTGKYHPKSSLGVGGLVRHTKSVSAIAEIFLGHPKNDDLSQEDKDDIRVACLIHDMVKLGDDPKGYTVHDHPLLVRTVLCPYEPQDSTTPDIIIDTWDRICDLVSSHMGTWNTSKNSDIVLPVPQTRKQNIVHMSDYIASRKDIQVDIPMDLPKTATGELPKDEPKVEEKATQKQLDYINGLLNKCANSFVDIPENILGTELVNAAGEIVLPKEKASEIIQILITLTNK